MTDKMFKTETRYTISYTKNGRTYSKTYINQEWENYGWARVQKLREQGVVVAVEKDQR